MPGVQNVPKVYLKVQIYTVLDVGVGKNHVFHNLGGWGLEVGQNIAKLSNYSTFLCEGGKFFKDFSTFSKFWCWGGGGCMLFYVPRHMYMYMVC